MIIAQFGFLGKALGQVFQYAQNAITRGLEAAESFKSFVSGGGVVEEDEWSGAYGLAQDAKEVWAGLFDIPKSYRISDEFTVASSFDWRRQYVMKMKILAEDLETGVVEDRWITVESDELLTRAEWEFYAQESVVDSIAGYTLDVYAVTEFNFYQRVRQSED